MEGKKTEKYKRNVKPTEPAKIRQKKTTATAHFLLVFTYNFLICTKMCHLNLISIITCKKDESSIGAVYKFKNIKKIKKKKYSNIEN